EVITPHAEIMGIYVVAGGQRIEGGAQFVGFAITEGSGPVVAAMRGEIKQENIVLMVLQGGNQGQQLCAAGTITMAKHDGGRAAEAWKEPAFADLVIQDSELHRVRASGKTLQINFRAGAFRFDDAIHEETRHAGGGQYGEKEECQNSGEKFGIPACGITKFREDGHA